MAIQSASEWLKQQQTSSGVPSPTPTPPVTQAPAPQQQSNILSSLFSALSGANKNVGKFLNEKIYTPTGYQDPSNPFLPNVKSPPTALNYAGGLAEDIFNAYPPAVGVSQLAKGGFSLKKALAGMGIGAGVPVAINTLQGRPTQPQELITGGLLGGSLGGMTEQPGTSMRNIPVTDTPMSGMTRSQPRPAGAYGADYQKNIPVADVMQPQPQNFTPINPKTGRGIPPDLSEFRNPNIPAPRKAEIPRSMDELAQERLPWEPKYNAENPIANRETAMQMLERNRKAKMPLPEVEVKKPTLSDSFPPEVINPEPIAQRGPGGQIWDYWTKNIDERVGKQGPVGKELKRRGDAIINESTVAKGMKDVEINLNMPKLNPRQQAEYFDAAEGRAIATDPQVIQAVEYNRKLATEFQQKANETGVLIDDATGQPIGNPQTYVPHTLNEAGKNALAKKPNVFFAKLAESNGITEADARTLWHKYIAPNRTVQAGFEKKREFNIPDEYLEKDPRRIWGNYNANFQKRVATAKHFGKNYEIAEELAGKIGQAQGDESIARNYIDTLTGRGMKNMPLENAATSLIQRAVHTKLSIMASIPNMQQGFLANTQMYGNKYALYGFLKSFSKEGRRWAKETGVVGKGFYSDFDKTNKVWNYTSGFPLTEDFNFISVANASKLFAKDMYAQLRKNPTDTYAAQKLDSMGIDWKKYMAEGATELPKEEIAKGAVAANIKAVFPKIGANIPEWAQNPMGRMSYLFWHYQLQNPKFLASEFEFGKAHGAKKLAQTTVTATILGEGVADVLALMKGEDRPDDVVERAIDNYLTVVGGVPFQFGKLATKFGGFGPSAIPTLGGPPVSSLVQSGSKVVQDLSKGENEKALEDLMRAWIRGDIPVGPYIPSGALIERQIPRITE
jgi:hypothetical protein